MDGEYYGCRWLQGGLAFNRRSIHACLIVHHDEGLPVLCDYNGGDLPLDEILRTRQDLAERNRRQEPTCCTGCPYLVRRRWPVPSHTFDIVGVAHFSHCNLECNYCYLQTEDPKSFADGFHPYEVVPVFRKLIAASALSPVAVIDWGGGEPSIYREFDDLLEMLSAYGCYQYVNTNGIRLPKNLHGGVVARRVHVVCSVDAGLPDTYFKMKKRNAFDQVWCNLKIYREAGCAVTVKYIVRDDNCAEAEIQAFLDKMESFGLPRLLVDIDYHYPVPSTKVLTAVAALNHFAARRGIQAEFGFTGARCRPEMPVEKRLDEILEQLAEAEAQSLGTGRGAAVGTDLRDQRIEALERIAEKRLESLRMAVGEIARLRAQVRKMARSERQRVAALEPSLAEADLIRQEAALREQDQFALARKLERRAERIAIPLAAAQACLRALHKAKLTLERWSRTSAWTHIPSQVLPFLRRHPADPEHDDSRA